MSYRIPLSLPNTVATMYALMRQYPGDVTCKGWGTPGDIFNDVKALPYRRDETSPECNGCPECVKRPAYTLILGGDCDDKAVLAGAALLELGYPVRIVTASYRDDGHMEHVYLEVWNGATWIPFDATFPTGEIGKEYAYTAKQIWS